MDVNGFVSLFMPYLMVALVVKFLWKLNTRVELVDDNSDQNGTDHLGKKTKSRKNTEEEKQVFMTVLIVSGVLRAACFMMNEFGRFLVNCQLMLLIVLPKSFWSHPSMLNLYKYPCSATCTLLQWFTITFSIVYAILCMIMFWAIELFEWVYEKLMVIKPQTVCYLSIFLWLFDYNNLCFMAALFTVYKVERNHSLMVTRVLCHLQPHMFVHRGVELEEQLKADRSCQALYTCLKLMEMTGKLNGKQMEKHIVTVKNYYTLKRFVSMELDLQPGVELNEKELERRLQTWIKQGSAMSHELKLAEDVIMEQVDQMLNAQMSNRDRPTPKQQQAPPPPNVDHSKCRDKTKRVKSQLDQVTRARDKLNAALDARVVEHRDETKSYKDRIKELHATIKSMKCELDEKDGTMKRLNNDISRLNGEKNKIKVQLDQRNKECRDKVKEIKRKISNIPAKDARIAELEKQVKNLTSSDKNDDVDNDEDVYTRPECQICTDYYSASHQPVRYTVNKSSNYLTLYLSLFSLKCGHVFGSTCITQWITKKTTCPTCSKTTSKNDFVTIYL